MEFSTFLHKTTLISFVASAFLFSGCGGGGSGSDSTSSSSSSSSSSSVTTACPSSAAITLKDVAWAAYRTGEGVWQVVSESLYANGTVNIPVGTDCKYSIAIVCEDEQKVSVGNFTSDEISESEQTCTDDLVANTYTVSGTVSGVEVGNGAWVSMDGYATWSTNPSAFTLEYIEAGTHDLVAIETDVDQVPQRFAINRDIEISGDTTGTAIDLSAGYALDPYSINVNGATYQNASIVTKNGSHISGIQKFDSSTWYMPQGGLISDDYIAFNSGRSDASNSITLGENKTISDAGDYSADITSIALLDVTTNGSVPVRFDGLDYDHADLLYYLAEIENDDGSGMRWDIMISNKWLGTDTFYTQSDFSALSGWNSSWNGFVSGKTVNWIVGAYIAVLEESKTVRGVYSGFLNDAFINLWIYIMLKGSFAW